jgi:hypothetical protein
VTLDSLGVPLVACTDGAHEIAAHMREQLRTLVGELGDQARDDGPLSTDSVADLLFMRTRDHVFRSLVETSLEDFTLSTVERGLVTEATDADGESVWLPVDGNPMTLADRVSSLVAAGALNVPLLFDTIVASPHCEAIFFEARLLPPHQRCRPATRPRHGSATRRHGPAFGVTTARLGRALFPELAPASSTSFLRDSWSR